MACEPGILAFRADRRAVNNSPSRWALYLNSTMLFTGVVGNEPKDMRLTIPHSGQLSLVFTNAYTREVQERRTLYLHNLKFQRTEKTVGSRQ